MPDPTPNYGLARPNFNISPWHDEVNGNFDLIDSILFAVVGVGNIKGNWQNNTAYVQGDRVVDPDAGSLWQCLISHTSASAPTTFAQDRAANPTFWSEIGFTFGGAVSWQTGTVYNINQFLVDAGRYGVVTKTYTSGASYDADVANGDVITLIDLSNIIVSPSTDNAIVRFDGTAGDLQNSGVTVDDNDNLSGVDVLTTNTISLTNGQIVFPATQNPSTNANTFDDYEEGSWTPTLNFSGGMTGITYTEQFGQYTKSGDIVVAEFQIQLSNKGTSTGSATIEGFPFAHDINSTGRHGGVVIGFYTDFTGLNTLMCSLQPNNVTRALLRNSTSTAAAVVFNTDFTNTSRFAGTATYVTSG